MKFYKVWGSILEPTDNVEPNDVFVICGAGSVRTGDILSTSKSENEYPNAIESSQPSCSVVLEVSKQGKEQALIKGLKVLTREDPSLSYHVDEESGEVILRGRGAFHLEISISSPGLQEKADRNSFMYFRFRFEANFAQPSAD